MDFELSEELQMLRDMARDFSAEKIAPYADEWDENHYFPYEEAIKPMAELGFFGTVIPEEYGGNEMGWLAAMILTEEIARASSSLRVQINMQTLGCAYTVLRYGSEEVKKKYIPKLVSAEYIGAFAITEPNAGSDAASIQTTAILEGDEWVINGTKHFITSGSIASVVVVMAKTDKSKGAKGISAFIVEKGTPGLKYGVEEDKLGLRGSVTAELIFEDCRVPKENLLGELNMGFIGAMNILDRGRTAIGAMSVGIAQGALEQSIAYAKQREQFGKPISKFQAIQWMIADMATEIEAARLLVMRAAYLEDKGERFTREAAMAKLFASEMATRAARKAIQIHGGYGYMKDLPLERFFRDVKLCEIGEGTSEVQRMVIARQLGL